MIDETVDAIARANGSQIADWLDEWNVDGTIINSPLVELIRAQVRDLSLTLRAYANSGG